MIAGYRYNHNRWAECGARIPGDGGYPQAGDTGKGGSYDRRDHHPPKEGFSHDDFLQQLQD